MGDYPNGHKAWLERHARRGVSIVSALCHGFLYLGRILEYQAWATGVLAEPHKPDKWWAEIHPNPMGE